MRESEGLGPKIHVGIPHALLLFSASASVLAYEILLMRLLSIGFWHQFAYMVISLALLGFGAAGSLLFLAFERIRRRLDEWLVAASGGTAISFSLAYSLSQKVGLDPLQLVWQDIEWLKMLATYLLMAVPFFLAGLIVGMVLTAAGERAHLMYAADLSGAAFGASAVVPALFLGPPWVLLPAPGILVLAAAGVYALGTERRLRGAVAVLLSAGLLAASYLIFPPIPRIHHTKALPMALAFPDARVEAERAGPLGMIHVVGSSLLREVPGLSLNFGIDEPKEASLPPQKEIFVDGDPLGPITRFGGRLEELAYLDFTGQALPYYVRGPENLLVIGTGGGTDVLLGLRHRVSRIVALEANRQVADLLKGPFARFSGDLYSRPEVSLELLEARQYLQASRERFDLIQMSLLDSFVSSAGGLHAATESYLYTMEALDLYLSRLSGRGVLSLTQWSKLPPRDSLRLLATAMAVLGKMQGVDRPDRHILFIRSWKTATILISRVSFSREEIARAIRFCDERSFDLAFFGGMKAEMANRYDILEEPYYFEGARALSGPEAKTFLNEYIFDLSPTTDDRPYFSHFFRWDKALTLFRHLRREWFPLVDSGYVFVAATLVQAVVAGAGLILLPLVFVRRIRGRSVPREAVPGTRDIFAVLIYFGSIGLGFMFLEMAFLPRFHLLLAHPIYSAAVVLSAILFFAGCGSIGVRVFEERISWFLWLPLAGLFVWTGLEILEGDRLFSEAMAWPFLGRTALTVGLISIPSFLLGWPFPSGFRATMRLFPSLGPWAWGINGCASVIGAVLGKALAMGIGFRALMGLALVLYLLAVMTFYVAFRRKERPGGDR